MGAGLLLCVLMAYLMGSIPFSYLAGRLRGVDLRLHGSGNLGASNTYRILGARAGATVLVLDVVKGAGAVLLAAWLAGRFGWEPAAWCRAAAALGAIAGHVWTIFLRFRGGKGVATAAGAFLGLAPVPAVISAAVWLALVLVTRYVSLGSMAGVLALPVGIVLLGPHGSREPGGATPEFWIALAAAVVVLAKHRSNIRRLIEGKENRLNRIRRESTP